MTHKNTIKILALSFLMLLGVASFSISNVFAQNSKVVAVETTSTQPEAVLLETDNLVNEKKDIDKTEKVINNNAEASGERMDNDGLKNKRQAEGSDNDMMNDTRYRDGEDSDNERGYKSDSENGEEEQWVITLVLAFSGLLAGLVIGRYKDILALLKKQISSGKKDNK